MKLNNQYPLAEIDSENPHEAESLLRASMRSYSPRSAGITIKNERRLIIGVNEIPEFIQGVTNDCDIPDCDRRSIVDALSAFLTPNPRRDRKGIGEG